MRSIVIGLIAAAAAATLASPLGQAQKTVADQLSLSGSQLVQLEQLYDYVHAVRFQEEGKKHPDLAQSTRSIRSAFDTAQREAKNLLSPGQVYLLENRLDAVRSAPQVQHRLPLVGSFEEFMNAPVDVEAAKRWLDARDQYRREQRNRSLFALGFGFCGHHHWCKPSRPRCGNGEIIGINPARRSSAPDTAGSTRSRGRNSVRGGSGGKR